MLKFVCFVVFLNSVVVQAEESKKFVDDEQLLLEMSDQIADDGMTFLGSEETPGSFIFFSFSGAAFALLWFYSNNEKKIFEMRNYYYIKLFLRKHILPMYRYRDKVFGQDAWL